MLRHPNHVQDRRQQGDRVFLKSEAQIRGAATNCYQPARTFDLSATGARLEFQHPLPPGTEVSVNLRPKPGQHIRLNARVAWQTLAWNGGFEAGVRFYPMLRSDRVQLERWLDDLQKS